MKKLILSLSAVVAMTSIAFAGETYTKESKSVAPPPCPQWYADNEFNLTLSGAYAFTGNEWRDDQYLGVDHAWGGSIDAKYFVHRYFGFGVQGTLLVPNDHDVIENGFTRVRVDGDDNDLVGTVLGTFTLRFPISCSRFAPYVWGGGGGIFGGGRDHFFRLNPAQPFGIERVTTNSDETKFMGQVGGGFEVRFTPHCGWTNDFSWNIVSGSNNNFGMARTGINFAF
ncbi:MAG TPA: hypothetical protein VJU77_18345 [Chthoniobacterales bacterium]|nr:hypothetical protein [Chthoniobacterales bacterium]